MMLAILYVCFGLLLGIMLFWRPEKRSVGLFFAVAFGWLPLFIAAVIVSVFTEQQGTV